MASKTLEAFYQNKKSLVQSIWRVTDEMSGAIGDDEVNDLDALLTRRQELMGQVDELDQQISLFATPESKQIQDLKLQIQGILQEIIALDAQHKENITKAQALIKGKIKDVMNRKVIQQAYYPHQRQSNGYFIDNKK